MERVTYPSETVKNALSRRFEHAVLDVEADAATAKLFAAEAIPVAIVLDAQGMELARLVGFSPPEEFAKWLDSMPR